MKSSFAPFAVLACAGLRLTACANTIRGVGQDAANAGQRDAKHAGQKIDTQRP